MSGINNPFAPPPNLAVQHTAARYPDVSADPDLQQAHAQSSYNQHQQQSQYGGGQQQFFQQSQQPQQQYYAGGQQNQQMQSPSTGYLQPNPTGFQPQTSFGQQLSAQMTGYPGNSAYGGGSPGGGAGMYGGQQQASQGYDQSYRGGSFQHQHQQQQQQNQSMTADLDPYGALGSLASAGTSSSATGGGRSPMPGGLNVQQNQGPHPREYVHSHKVELMSWDNYAWKQLLNSLDNLRETWEARKSLVQDAGRQGGDPSQIESLRRQADENVDSVHASKFQLVEVQTGWKHSTDAASKARVREALNAGLNSLPDFPRPLGPEQIGGAFHQRAHEDYRKQSILASFALPQGQTQQQYQYQQQQQQQGMMQPQATGWGGQQQSMMDQGMYGQQQQQPQGYGQNQSFMQPQQTGFYGQMGGQQGFYR